MNTGFPALPGEYDYACVVFAEYQDALDFCAGRFFDTDGKPVAAARS